MQKILKIAVIALCIIGLILFVVLLTSDDQSGIIDIMMNLVYVLLAITALVALAFTIVNIAGDGKKLVKTGISIGVFAVVALVSYGIADGSDNSIYTGEISEGGSQAVGMGLYLFYFLAAIAVALMLFFGVRKVFK